MVSKKKKRKRGRPKGSKNKYAGIPHNYGFWYCIIKSEEKIKQFRERGNKRQKYELEEAIKYYHKTKDIKKKSKRK